MSILEELEKRFLLQEEYFGNDKPVNRITPLVSVTVITYQHANYIRGSLDGILMQQTEFPYEIIIGEDGSTDGTREICLEYAGKHPDKIRLFLRDRNCSHYKSGNQSVMFNFHWTLMSARGKYIALCEGDDYWIDPSKLQKQVDFLESNNDFNICFHHVHAVDESSIIIQKSSGKKAYIYNQVDFLIHKKEVRTCSTVYRRDSLPQPIPPWLFYVYAGDKFIKALSIGDKKGITLKDVMACYRIHKGGVWSSLNNKQLKEKMDNDQFWIEEIFGKKYPKLIPFLKDRHNYTFISAHLERGNYKMAWLFYMKMFKYPKYFLRDETRKMNTLLRLIVYSLRLDVFIKSHFNLSRQKML